MKNWYLIVIGICMAMPANAEDYVGWGDAPMYTSEYFMNSAFAYNNRVLTEASINSAYSTSSDAYGNVRQTPAGKSTKATLASSTATSKWPKKLAQKFSKEHRKEWQRVFSLSLNTYKKLEKKLKIPKNDLAGSIAGYIAGNYMVYHNISISDNDFVSLVNQMRSLLINIPQLIHAKKSAKRDLYELTAIGGTFMVIAMLDLQKQPNQAISDSLQRVAKDNLEQFFGASIFNIEIVNGGLVIH